MTCSGRGPWSFGTVQVVAKHAPSLLDHEKGRVGTIGLPWMLLTQVLLPLGGPLADMSLLYLLLVGNTGTAAATLALAMGLDLALMVVTVLADGEDRNLVLLARCCGWSGGPSSCSPSAVRSPAGHRGPRTAGKVVRYNSVDTDMVLDTRLPDAVDAERPVDRHPPQRCYESHLWGE